MIFLYAVSSAKIMFQLYKVARTLCKCSNVTNKRNISCTNSLNLFWEHDDKGGYFRDQKLPPFKDRMREGLKELKNEIKLWTEEVKETFEWDPKYVYRQGEVDVLWRFQNENSLKPWVVTSDKDLSEGFSTCSLNLTPQGRGLFSGNLSLRVPKDGRVRRAGYCNIRTMRARKSFKREAYLDWTPYNMLVMKVRGDGRSYMLNIHTTGYYDITWNDIYHFVLYTRGGPYWQVARIPFSKFFLGSKGRIQDKQHAIPLNKVTSFGISAAQRYPGEFSLEIDYIGLEHDPSHKEEFAYEMYEQDKYIVGS